jgi:two-component system, NarL family, sensor histidine kinase EvgS
VDYRWRTTAQGSAVTGGRDLVSAEERAWLAALPEIRVALDRSGLPPYEWVSPDGEISGLQVDMLITLARLFGVRVRPVVYPSWPAVLNAVRERKADMVLTSTATAERLSYMTYTLGTAPVPMAMYAASRASTRPPQENAVFALEREFAANDTVRRRYPQATIANTTTRGEALRTVLDGRADYYVGSVLETNETLAREKLAGLELVQPVTVGTGYYHLGIRKDWAQLATVFNRAIAARRQEQQQGRGAEFAGLAPGHLVLSDPLLLSPQALEWLAQTSVVRAGAVRGLALLNDVNPQGAHSGIAADYLEIVAQRLGVGVEVVPFANVAEMLAALRAGRIHLVPFLTMTPQRAQDFAFSSPYLAMPYVLIGRTDGPSYWDLGSLRGQRLALAEEHPLRPLVRERHPQVQIVSARNGQEAMAMVRRGEAEAAVEVRHFANLGINESGGYLRALGEVGELPAAFHFAMHPGAATLLPSINQALADILPAERERMLRRWVALDLRPGFAWQRWLPAFVVAGVASLILLVMAAWWIRTLLAARARDRRHAELITDIGRTLPGGTFRYVLDGEGRVVRLHITEGTAGFLGVTQQPGQMVHEMMMPRLDPAFVAPLKRALLEALAGRKRFEFTTPYNHPDGRRMWVYAEVLPGQTSEGQTTWTGYVIDVTQRHQLQERVERDAEERYVMLASASHELRAPSHTVALALQSLPETAVAPEHRGTVGVARDAARTLHQLLDDVLDVARARRGRIEVRPLQFGLAALFDQVADSQARLIAERGLVLDRQIAPDTPKTMLNDALRLKQVLTNLLNNAAKYTERGSIRFTMAPATGPGFEGGGVVFTIADSGPGIPDVVRARLFEPFAAGSAPLRADLRSSGLGLNLCRHLLDMMGGRLVLDSHSGRGTTVQAFLPLRHPAHARVLPAVPGEGIVLVCDDDPVGRMLLAEMLRQPGYTVEAVADARTAIERLRSGGVRVLVTDLNMPDMRGDELLRSVHAQQRAGATTRPLLVVCSGDPPPGMSEAVAPLHDTFISKPVDMATLLDALATHGVRAPTAEARDPAALT